jgi:hypothetical protein
MGNFFTGNDYDMPTSKSYGDSYNEGVNALINSMGNMYSAESQWAPLFNQLYRNEQSTAMQEYNNALQQMQLQSLQEYAPQLAAAQLAYEKEYGPQFVAQQVARQREADPTYWGIRDTLGSQVESDLANGNQLSAAQQRLVNQNSRASMAARGGSSSGYAPAAQEVLGEFLAGEGLKTQRQNAASNFMSMGANSPQLTQTGAAPTTGISENSFSTMNPYLPNAAMQAGNNAANYNQNIYGQQVQWAQNANNQPSMFANIFGTLTNAVGTGALAKQAFS